MGALLLVFGFCKGREKPRLRQENRKVAKAGKRKVRA